MDENKFEKKVNELCSEIYQKLSLLIDNDYILVDLPYHSNIGDVLIWEGERQFLSKLPYKCLYKASMYTYKKPKVDRNTIVLIHGGGNWGDVWRGSQEFHLKIIQEYPHNRIIVFPQTVHYDNLCYLTRDANVASKHPRLTICARDLISYKLLKENYTSNNILLVPDMAFCIPISYLAQYKQAHQNRDLFLKRSDKELVPFEINRFTTSYLVKDWPSMENKSICSFLLRFFTIGQRLKVIPSFWVDYFADNVVRENLVKTGVSFLSKHEYIYTTRLHGAILALLLGKRFFLINNNYGKNKNFFETWLTEKDEDIHFLDI